MYIVVVFGHTDTEKRAGPADRTEREESMITEYTIKITDSKGKVSTSVFPKKYADEKALDYRKRLTDCKVEYFKVTYNGSSFYKAEKIF